jgi:hypothetical protein
MPDLHQAVEPARSGQEGAVRRRRHELHGLSNAARPVLGPAAFRAGPPGEHASRSGPHGGSSPPKGVHRLVKPRRATGDPPTGPGTGVLVEGDLAAGPDSKGRAPARPVGATNRVLVRAHQLQDLTEFAAYDRNVAPGAHGQQSAALVLQHGQLVRRLVGRGE